jgi:hypothetical protein
LLRRLFACRYRSVPHLLLTGRAVSGPIFPIDDATGEEIAAHEAFWFGWSQFHPTTQLFEI